MLVGYFMLNTKLHVTWQRSVISSQPAHHWAGLGKAINRFFRYTHTWYRGGAGWLLVWLGAFGECVKSTCALGFASNMFVCMYGTVCDGVCVQCMSYSFIKSIPPKGMCYGVCVRVWCFSSYSCPCSLSQSIYIHDPRVCAVSLLVWLSIHPCVGCGLRK